MVADPPDINYDIHTSFRLVLRCCWSWSGRAASAEETQSRIKSLFSLSVSVYAVLLTANQLIDHSIHSLVFVVHFEEATDASSSEDEDEEEAVFIRDCHK